MMKMTVSGRRIGLFSGVGLAALALTTPALAQDVAATTDQDSETVADPAETAEVITVTGSRISRPNLESTVPVTSISGDTLFKGNTTNIGDQLNDLPQLRSTFAQQNPGLGVGIAGLNLLDLRGLGSSRTLVLVNGRRHVPADILVNAVSPDVNSIPNDLIERVDIVTGANSAVYGSDAIAGVVNFVLRRNFEGVQVRAQAGVTEAGFGGNQYISAMVGTNFADDRGNVILHGEYSRADRVFGSDVPAFRRQDGLGVIDVDTTGLPSGSDGFPDRAFFRDFRTASINRFGLIPITQSGSNPTCGTGLGSTNGPGGVGSGGTVGTPYNCTFIFDANGALAAQTGTRFGTGIIGSIIGGNGQTGREDKLLSVLPFNERYNFNMLAHFTVSDAFEPFIEAKWNRVNALGSNAGPSFIQGTFTQFDIRERVRLDNPFLTSAQRATISNAILASGCNTSLTQACNVTGINNTFTRITGGGQTAQGVGGPLNAADIAAINAGTYRFVLSRNLLDSGIRDEEFQRDTYRIVVGARGAINDRLNYEISANYGKFKETTTTYGYLNRQRFLLSLDAGLDPATNTIKCRAQFDPSAAVAFAGQGANLAADIAACVPYNPFGGSDNSAAARYFVYNATNRASLSQLDIQGFVSGDLGGLFELPGGPISFSVGAEYRRERAFYDNDDFIETGATNAVVVGAFDPDPFSVREVFGEVRIPLLADMPLFHELTLSGAGRISNDSITSGNSFTYNGGIDWAPIEDIRFRASYGKAVRVPNVSETGFPAVPNFAPGFADPCASSNIANNPARQANCTADLGAALLAGLPNTTYSLPIISGSNPNLDPETSKSITVGAVFQPSFIPGFSLSVDYYDIQVDKVIVSLSAQAIANGCYDQPTLNNPLCSVFTRWRGPGTGPLGELPGQILGNSLVSAPVNFAKRVRRGIDVNLNYRTQISENVGIDASLIYVHGIQSSNFQDPSRPTFENRLLGELGDPIDEFRFDIDLRVSEFTFGYRMRYIGPQVVNAWEDFYALPAACIGTNCPPNNLDYADRRTFEAVFYHDLRFSIDLKDIGGFGKDYQLFIGANNILDTLPPLGSTATGAGSAIYDFRGRNYTAGIRARF